MPARNTTGFKYVVCIRGAYGAYVPNSVLSKTGKKGKQRTTWIGCFACRARTALEVARFMGPERVARELEAEVRGKSGEMYTSAGTERRAYGLVHTPAGATPKATPKATPRATPARATPGARVDDSPAVGGEFWGASTATPLRDMDDDMEMSAVA